MHIDNNVVIFFHKSLMLFVLFCLLLICLFFSFSHTSFSVANQILILSLCPILVIVCALLLLLDDGNTAASNSPKSLLSCFKHAYFNLKNYIFMDNTILKMQTNMSFISHFFVFFKAQLLSSFPSLLYSFLLSIFHHSCQTTHTHTNSLTQTCHVRGMWKKRHATNLSLDT